MTDRAALYQQIQESGGIADLSARTKIHLTGTDRQRYLNGQVTRDILKIIVSETLRACVTSVKGKLCADALISANDELLCIDADPALRESLVARLERYIIADDVTLTDATDEESLIHLFGLEKIEDPPNNLQNLPIEIPGARIIRSDRLGKPGLDIFLPRTAFQETWNSLTAKFPVIDEPMQETLRIEAGIPRWGFELEENTLPAEAGLDRTAVDFHKGCYIGQEVISRIKSVGHVNRALTGFLITSDDDSTNLANPANDDLAISETELSQLSQLTGAKLFANSEPDQSDKPVGQLTSATHSYALNRTVALGFLKRGVAAAPLIIQNADGKIIGTATIHPLPFQKSHASESSHASPKSSQSS